VAVSRWQSALFEVSVKNIYVNNLTAGMELVNEAFLLEEVAQRSTKDGRPFLLFKLRDKTGLVGAVCWDVPDHIQSIAENGAVLLVTGQVVTYRDALQINVTDMNAGGQVNLAEFLPASSRPRQEMLLELEEQIAGLGQPWQQLVSTLLLREPFLSLFASAPAARSMHHAYIGGLLEHSLSMAALANILASHYPSVKRDLLVAGALLHDMGKAVEYDVSGGFSFSDDGRLVGHIVRAIIMIEMAAAELDINESTLRQLVHLIASHHGKSEWGSPVEPKTIEAVLLHQIDMIDSRAQGFYDHLAREQQNGRWTQNNSYMFGTELMYPEDWSGEG
jgi:3'-5' exoribonuclease